MPRAASSVVGESILPPPNYFQEIALAIQFAVIKERNDPMAHNYKRVFAMTFASIYPMYLTKVEKKGHGKDELDQVLSWITGYDETGLEKVIADEVDLETFFAQAPEMNPNTSLIKGVICGYRVEDIEDPTMQKIRYMDKLVDELARGKKMSSILRGSQV